MTILVRRRDGSSFECVNGLHRLRAGLQVFGRMRVRDQETGEEFDVHEVEGQLVVLSTPAQDFAETKAAKLIAKARQRLVD
jgi:hypothetical protein